MIYLSLHRIRRTLSTFVSRLFTSPGNPRETVLFGGPDPNRNCTASGTVPMVLKEQLTFSAETGPGVSARESTQIRLRVSYSLPLVDTQFQLNETVRVWFSPNGLGLMEDIENKGLEDVVFDAIAL